MSDSSLSGINNASLNSVNGLKVDVEIFVKWDRDSGGLQG